MSIKSLLNGYSKVMFQLAAEILWRCGITSCGFGEEAF